MRAKSEISVSHLRELRAVRRRLTWVVTAWEETVLLSDPPEHLIEAIETLDKVLVEVEPREPELTADESAGTER